jgi:REP element-mobilizing transposase RayT
MKRRVYGFGDCCYHVVSRINEQRYYLGDEQKAVFLGLLQRAAVFSGVELLTFCLMDNHFHLLIRVPERVEIDDKELLRRLRTLYRENEYKELLAEYRLGEKDKTGAALNAFRKRYLRRMYDLSEFMRTLKQRFSIWYNRGHERHGPLWDGRFRSVLVQSSPDEMGTRSLSTMAAYIELNPVRAGLVDDPADYAWCGYGCAVRGDKAFLDGIRYIFERSRGLVRGCKQAFDLYQRLILCAAMGNADGYADERLDALARKGRLPSPGDLLRARHRAFSRGWLFGGKDFVERMAGQRPECFQTGCKRCASRLQPTGKDLFFTARFV